MLNNSAMSVDDPQAQKLWLALERLQELMRQDRARYGDLLPIVDESLCRSEAKNT